MIVEGGWAGPGPAIVELLPELEGRDVSFVYIEPNHDGLFEITAYYRDENDVKYRLDTIVKVSVVQHGRATEAVNDTDINRIKTRLQEA